MTTPPRATGPNGRGDRPGYQLGGITGRGFVPGRSGNPTGLPRGVDEVRRYAQRFTKLAVDELARIAQESRNDRARVMACVALLDRGWGKPPQMIAMALPPGTGVIRLVWPGPPRPHVGAPPARETNGEGHDA